MGIQTAIIAASAMGQTQIIAAGNAQQKIRVVSGVISASGAVNIKFQGHNTDLTGLLYFLGTTPPALAFAYGEFLYQGGMGGFFDAAAGLELNINLSAAVPVGGWLNWLYVVT